MSINSYSMHKGATNTMEINRFVIACPNPSGLININRLAGLLTYPNFLLAFPVPSCDTSDFIDIRKSGFGTYSSGSVEDFHLFPS